MHEHHNVPGGPLADIAQPGDTDLDLDCDGLTITGLVTYGQELIVSLEGGFGSFISTEGELCEMPPGDETAGLTEVEIVICFRDATEYWFARYLAVLEDWQARAVPLRMCCAAGKITSLIEDNSHWLPVPRSRPRPR